MARTLDVTQQGDSINLYIYYDVRDDGSHRLMPEGYDMKATLYDYKGRPMATCTTEDGSMVVGYDFYRFTVAPDVSACLAGAVGLELSMYDDDGFMDYASDIVYLDIESRLGSDGETIVPDYGIEPLTDEEINELMS